MATIRPSYTVKKIVLTAKNIDRIVGAINQRKIRTGVVKSILEQLRLGKHFESPISVNFRDGDYRLFDGGHRTMAMRRFFDEHPNEKIEVTMHVYDNLSDEEEREEYTIVNKGTKQSTNDVVKQYASTIPAFQLMLKGWQKGGKHNKFACPVTAYPSPNSVSFYRLVSAYFAAQQENFMGGYPGTAFEFIDKAQDLTKEDVFMMNAFMKDFIDAFGPLKNNGYVRSTPFTAIFRLWYDNRMNIPANSMPKRLEKLCKDASVQEVSRAGGMGATVSAHQVFKIILNASRTRYLFK
jgi:hypothetical protein